MMLNEPDLFFGILLLPAVALLIVNSGLLLGLRTKESVP
jgi:hypothetical protein